MARQESKVSSFFQKIGPMVGYNAASILFGGGGYIISLYFLSFLTEVEKLSVDQAGMVIAMAHIWDAVTDPVMGIITDRTRSKYGSFSIILIFSSKISALGRYSDSCLVFLPVELVRHLRYRQQDRNDALLHARVYAL